MKDYENEVARRKENKIKTHCSKSYFLNVIYNNDMVCTVKKAPRYVFTLSERRQIKCIQYKYH